VATVSGHRPSRRREQRHQQRHQQRGLNHRLRACHRLRDGTSSATERGRSPPPRPRAPAPSPRWPGPVPGGCAGPTRCRRCGSASAVETAAPVCRLERRGQEPGDRHQVRPQRLPFGGDQPHGHGSEDGDEERRGPSVASAPLTSGPGVPQWCHRSSEHRPISGWQASRRGDAGSSCPTHGGW
jgi:hypothetical protein